MSSSGNDSRGMDQVDDYAAAVQKAFRRWQEFRPKEGGSCCGNSHFIMIEDGSRYFKEVPKPDANVCNRERAWRDYVRVRDKVLVH